MADSPAVLPWAARRGQPRGLRRFRIPAVAAAMTVALVACGAPRPEPEKTALEVRAFQTRIYDGIEIKAAMRAVLNVLQDEGYAVTNAETDLGLLVASKQTDLSPAPSGSGAEPSTAEVVGGVLVLAAIIAAIAVLASSGDGRGGGASVSSGDSDDGGVDKTEIIDCTANVSGFGEQTRIRLSFQRKVLDERGRVRRVEAIEEPTFYEAFFAKIDKGLFLEREQL